MKSVLGLLSLAGLAAVVGCQRPLAPAEQVVAGDVDALRLAFGGGASSGPAAAVAAAEPTGWATISGRFTFEGAIPDRKALTVDKDQSVCAPGGKAVLGEEVVIDPATKGIKDVVIFLTTKYPAGDPKWEHADYAATASSQVEFDQRNCVFLSHMFAMRSSQVCKVLNSDPVGHNTNIAGGGKAKPENISVAANAYTTYSPGGESPEPFAVACSIHPWMSARMLVRNSPYFAVTKPDGTFEIANVPAGVDLEFRVWQERANYLQDVTVNGAQQKWPKGRLKLKLDDGQPQTLDVVVNASVFAK
jgi:hypothetical protein